MGFSGFYLFFSFQKGPQRKLRRVEEGRGERKGTGVSSCVQIEEISEGEEEPSCEYSFTGEARKDESEAPLSFPESQDSNKNEMIHFSAFAGAESRAKFAGVECAVSGVCTPDAAAEAARAPAADPQTSRSVNLNLKTELNSNSNVFHHKVLKPLPQTTPQFDFGLFIVRAAAMSRHADDIFPLLEDEEVNHYFYYSTF